MPAEHDIDLGLVENRHEQPADLLFAVPTALAARDHVQEYHVQRSFAVGVAGHHLPQPFGLLRAVGVRGGQSVVADVAVGFVFAAVEHQEEDRTLPEGGVGFAGRGGEVVEVAVRRRPAVFMVAARGEDRDAGRREQLRGRVEVSVE